MLAKLPILSYTTEAAQWHAIARAKLRQVGTVIPFADGQIAAIARVNHLILVTRNLADYQALQELNVENWFS